MYIFQWSETPFFIFKPYCPDLSRENFLRIQELLSMNSLADNKKSYVSDVLVIGGGPAGSLCATELSRLKYRVVLVDPEKTVRRIEGLSPRAVQLLRSKKMYGGLACISKQLKRTVDWGGLRNSSNGEHIVLREELDQGLRDDARKSGVKFVSGMANPSAIESSNGFKITTLSDTTQVQSRYIVDARGRRGQASNKTNASPENIAFGGFIDGIEIDPGTLVKAIDNGWLWLARKDQNQPVWAQLMIHKGTQSIGRSVISEQLLAVVQRALKQNHLTVSGQIVSRGADFRLNESASTGDPFDPLRIGDASVAFDPLSGHGMFWAISSALSAVAILNTLLQCHDATSESLCRRFYQQRLTDTYWRQARIGRDFYRLEENRSAQFWEKRKNWPDLLPAHQNNSDVISFNHGPAIEHGKIVERELVCIPGNHGAVAWFGSIPLASTLKQVLSLAKKSTISPELLHQRCIPYVSLHEATRFWHWLHSNDLLNISTHIERGN